MSRTLKAILFALLLQWAPVVSDEVMGEAAQETEIEEADESLSLLQAALQHSANMGAELEGGDQEETNENHEEEGEENEEHEDAEHEEGAEHGEDVEHEEDADSDHGEEEDAEHEEDTDSDNGAEEDDAEHEEGNDEIEEEAHDDQGAWNEVLDRIMEKHDEDHDGKISLTELLELYRDEAEGEPEETVEADPTQKMEEALQKVDADKDSLLDREELMSLHELLVSEERGAAASLLQVDEGEEDEDTVSEGHTDEEDEEDVVEEEEETGEEVPIMTPENLDSVMKEHDADQDGKISLIEFHNLYKQEHGIEEFTPTIPTALEDAFHKVDANKDSLLDHDEMMRLSELVEQNEIDLEDIQ